jgi:hypothetical protein
VDSGDPCVAPICDPASGVCGVPVADGTACDDGNVCTANDACVSGVCTSAPTAGGTCDDGDPCTVGDTCTGGACAGAAKTCPSDGNACTADTCNPADGSCGLPVGDGGPCDDGDLCTTDTTCTGGVCGGGTSVTCSDDGDPCTADVCDPATGSCGMPAADGAPCDDGEQCTLPDGCTGGICSGPTYAGCADPEAQLTCLISGLAGSTFKCPIRLVRGSEAAAPPTALQFNMLYDGTQVTLDHFLDGEKCFPNGVCVPYKIPGTFTALDTGHSVSLSPTLASWVDGGSVLLSNSGDPTAVLTDAYWGSGIVVGNDLIFEAVFILDQEIPAATPVEVTLDKVVASDQAATALPVQIQDLVITTSP